MYRVTAWIAAAVAVVATALFAAAVSASAAQANATVRDKWAVHARYTSSCAGASSSRGAGVTLRVSAPGLTGRGVRFTVRAKRLPAKEVGNA
jgi:hypothetical protein